MASAPTGQTCLVHASDTNGAQDVLVVGLATGAVQRGSVGTNGLQGAGQRRQPRPGRSGQTRFLNHGGGGVAFNCGIGRAFHWA